MKGVLILILPLLSLLSCREDPVPKPRAYLRIDLPVRNYASFDTTFPYSFEYPDYIRISGDKGPASEPYWMNLDIPGFHARIHLSYKRVDGNLANYLDDTHKMVMKHIPKSTGIGEEQIAVEENRVFGTIFDIRGSEAASALQFYCTDSSRHFIRGALYFNQSPNNDSLRPVIDFIREDVVHLFETLRWKDN